MTYKLKQVLAIQSYSYEQFRMFRYIIGELVRMNVDYHVIDGNIYAIKGIADKYPCIVSHMDTVHEIVEDLTVVEMNGNLTGLNSVTMEQTGIGGDDKVGIYIALQCLEQVDCIKSVFFRDEEVGCNGSYEADVSFFSDCRFVLQCDRRGNKDFITNASGIALSSDLFQKDVLGIINAYGYKFENGMMTDVMALKELGVECSMANISCGYYNPHTAAEYVNIDDVFNTLEMVLSIIYNLVDVDYPIKYKRRSYTWTKSPTTVDKKPYSNNWYYGDDDLGDWCGDAKKKSLDEYIDCFFHVVLFIG